MKSEISSSTCLHWWGFSGPSGPGWVLALALLGGSVAAQGGDCVYQEEDGLLAIEIESGQLAGDWVFETDVTNYAGDGYLRWNGPNHFSSPGHGVFGFDFQIEEGGWHLFRIRNHHDHPDSTEENDVWVRMDGGQWVKLFSSVAHQWTWSSYHEFSHDDKPPAGYDLSPGQHRIEFSGRSSNFRMDRFHLFTPGHPHGSDWHQPESECGDGGGGWDEPLPPVPVIRLSPDSIPAGDAYSTVITLDGRNSWDPNGDSLSYSWHVRGARFVQGTNRHSMRAKIRIPGGRVWPIRLTVTDDSDEHLSARKTVALNVDETAATVGGEPVAWHAMSLTFEGPTAHEADSQPNPFKDYRLTVLFDGPRGQEYLVHGFFDGDGDGASQGNVWRVMFSADEGGLWRYTASFREGSGVATSMNPDGGSPAYFDGDNGSIIVDVADSQAPGFLSKGRLGYVGEHYLRFANGEYYLKGGTDSPENFLGYEGFDDIHDNGGLGIIHRYPEHRADWRPGDPYFVSNTTGYDSKGIIGALNYLSREGVNSIYFLPMNLGGDGQETCPFPTYESTHYAKRHYDVSRMRQWAQVFEHATRKGILMHFVLAETESPNENWLDRGELGVERKIFYRELVARFGHAMAIKWNLCEENDYDIEHLREFASYIDYLDPYDHPITVHTHPDNFQDYEALKGDPLFTSTSIQYSPNSAGQHVEEWREKSAAAGRPWILDMDENNPAQVGITGANTDEIRKRIMYDVYFSGGQVEWYAGYHPLPLGGDVRMEDFSTRESMWRSMRIAREFIQDNLPFWRMEPMDHLLAGGSTDFGGPELFALSDRVYAIYLPNANPTPTIDLTSATGQFTRRWFNPRTGEFEGPVYHSGGGAVRGLGQAPSDRDEDWIVLISKD